MAGNVTYDNRTGGGYGYAYNAANRMSEFSINGVVQAEYVYNALGQQAIRRLTQAGKTLHVIHDAEGNRLAEYEYDPVLATSTLLREYVWFGMEAVGVVENDTLYLIRSDQIGRPIFATDGFGTKVWEASYLPFGGVHVTTGTPLDLRFPGQWFQSETGLHQNWMRDYDPTTGRYHQADPLGLVDGPSVYGYALQNPGRYADPMGLQAVHNADGSISMPGDFSSPQSGSQSVAGGAVRIGGKLAGGVLVGILSPTTMGDGTSSPPYGDIARENGSCGDPCEEAKNRLRKAKQDTVNLKGKLSCVSRGGRPRGLTHAEIVARIDILQREVSARADALRFCKDKTGRDHPGELAAKQRTLNSCWKQL